jgi:uncharacterized protein YdeI (YjbR/CyaY-like superfamily)
MELYFRTREEWRQWLVNNHSHSQGVWLIYYKKVSGKTRIPYNEAVEEAICFGWIDGKIKSVNEDCYMQWYTPRRKGSKWSKLNISRAQNLIAAGRMEPAGMVEYEKAIKKPDLVYNVRSDENIQVPDDLMSVLKSNSAAYDNFISFPPSSRKLYIFWLNSAKREETRKKRIERIVENSIKNIRAGMM